MDSATKEALWHPFGAAIDTLGAAIRACPDPLWRDRARQPEFWYSARHVLFFLDCDLSPSAEGFRPPAPFTLAELDPAGVLPERVYEREELLASNLRHVQHHAAQVNPLLRRHCGAAPRWISSAEDAPPEYTAP